uniref:GATOR complex protein NPRL3 n=1 Tax=Branchiostoma floridae TaxID=7739 RepID=C3YC70_BRAFL|eukprot:XP_002606092.1 hypothetical protein BRAFLDRAFT_88002 [Branchiostoma floridae]
MADCSPISIILVSSGSLRGDRLLFRYPYQELPCKPAISPDKILATLMATKTELAGEKFELKVDNLRFVGHPTLLHQISSFTDLSKSEGPSPRREPSPIILFNIVFVIQANVSPSLNQYYHDLSKRLALAIRHEEWRCGYLNKQAQIMRDVHDEVSAMPEEELPQDCSPALTRLIRIATPLKSLQCLSQDSDLALSQIFQLVSHLVYWGKATIIYPLAESNVYTLSPNAKTSVNSLLCEKFLEQFPGVCLPAIMADFSLPLPLGEHRNPLGLPQQQAQLVQMVVWMLQHRLLVQSGVAIASVPDDVARNRTISGGSEAISVGSPDGGELELSSSVETYSTYSTEMGSDGMLITKDARLQRKLTESLLSDLTEGERLSVLKVPAASNPEDLRLFARLVWYFRGQHHLEEIMYYENLRRSQLLTLLDKFREVLITCQHEDAAAAVFHTKQY